MPLQEISLNGSDWKALQLMPSEWEWRRVWETADTLMPALWIRGTVPGTVQDDAFEAGLIPDYAFDLNSRCCEWTSERDWVYLKEFATPESARGAGVPPAMAGETPALRDVVRLHFEGVDYACHVYLNGQHVGDHVGMYDAFDFDITALLAAEGAMNKLVIVLEHAPREIGQIGRTSQVKLWKARFAYDWDWCVRLVPIGIFDRVSLLVTGPAFVEDVHVTTQLADDYSAADVQLNVAVHAPQTTKLRVQTLVGPAGGKQTKSESPFLASSDDATFSHCLTIKQPALWWPNGYGEQPLYQATVRLLDGTGRCLDERTVTFGIRRVRALPNDDAPADALPYVLEVNGQRVFDKGWNWAPVSQLYGRETPDRYTRWLTLARDANCNLLRVWGGGLLEKEAFYNLCDRFGIMVWQEFIHSSSGLDNRPSSDPEYLDYIRGQAEKMIPRKRNHASLIIWCGGNELMHDNWTPLDSTWPALAVLRDCVQRLDPDRLWLPTSASGPSANADPAKAGGGMHDVHGPWQYQGPQEHYAFYNAIDPLLHAEFGVEGAANLAAMKASNSEGNLWPPDDTNPVYMHKGAWWVQKPMMERVFGPTDDIATYVVTSQFLQAEGLRYAIESNRRRKWHCAGTSPWQFNESWPNLSCTNVVDFYGQTRPAYWWCRRAYEMLHVSARYDKLGWQAGETFTAQLWVNNSLTDQPLLTLLWDILDLRGDALATGQKAITAPACGAVQADDIEWPVPEVAGSVFILRLRLMTGAGTVSRNDYVFSTASEPVFAPLREAPRTQVQATRTDTGIQITNTGAAMALFARLDTTDLADWVSFSDNYVLLVPGESLSVTCTPNNLPVELSGMNFDPVSV